MDMDRVAWWHPLLIVLSTYSISPIIIKCFDFQPKCVNHLRILFMPLLSTVPLRCQECERKHYFLVSSLSNRKHLCTFSIWACWTKCTKRLFELFLYILATKPDKYPSLAFSARLNCSLVNPLDPELYQFSLPTPEPSELGDNNLCGQPLLLTLP